jgi:ubiquinone/menaquinone biosynthesis C-methylase UbiE
LPEGARARAYDRLRPVDENWREVFELLVREGDFVGRRVLDVGCGTGRLLAALAERGARVWGIDPSPEMVAAARTRGSAKVARAERMPFKDGWFERAVLWLTVHLVERPQAFAELRRVLAAEGRLTIATFDPSHFDRFWLNEIFPSLERIDRERFPSEDELAEELLAAGFEPRVTRLSQHAEITREAALERIRGRYISTLELLSEDEYLAGLERAERELPDEIGYALEWLVVIAVRS